MSTEPFTRRLLDAIRSQTPEQRAAARARLDAAREQYHAELRGRLAAPPAPTEAELEAHLRRAGVGDVHLQKLASLSEDVPSLQAARAWWGQPREEVDGDLRRRHPWLALLGPRGVGKTQAAAWCLLRYARGYPWNQAPGGGKPPVPLAFVPWGTFNSFAPWEHEHELDEWGRAGLLVLDDVGEAMLTVPAREAVRNLLDARYRGQRLTVLTSALDGPGLQRYLDPEATPEAPGHSLRRIMELGWVVEVAKGRKTYRRLGVDGQQAARAAGGGR